MQTERWVADRAMLPRLIHLHPDWTQPQLAAWIGRSLGWIKKWVKRLREAPVGNSTVLFGLPRGRTTAFPATHPQLEERMLAIRDASPENLKRVPGPRAIVYFLQRDPEWQGRAETVPRSTRTIGRILRRNGRIVPRPRRRPHEPLERAAPLHACQLDLKDVSTVPCPGYLHYPCLSEAYNVNG